MPVPVSGSRPRTPPAALDHDLGLNVFKIFGYILLVFICWPRRMR